MWKGLKWPRPPIDMFCRFCKKTFLNVKNNFKTHLFGKYVWAFQWRHLKFADNFTTSSHLGVENMEKCKKLFFLLSNVTKLSCEVSRINNFQRKKCACLCLGDDCEKCFELVIILAVYDDFSSCPQLAQQQLYLWNGYIDLHWDIPLGKVLHRLDRGEFIARKDAISPRRARRTAI